MFWVMMISAPGALALAGADSAALEGTAAEAEVFDEDAGLSGKAGAGASSGLVIRRNAPRDSGGIGTRKELAACMAANADSGLVTIGTSGERERKGCGSFCGKGASDGLTCGASPCAESLLCACSNSLRRSSMTGERLCAVR